MTDRAMRGVEQQKVALFTHARRTVLLPSDAYPWLAVWLSDNALASINVVALRQTRLILGWVTVCGRVNHLGM